MSVGNKIREARQVAGFTQDELAKATGVSRNTVSRWEHGKSIPSIEDIEKIALVLDVPTDSFNQSSSNDYENKELIVAYNIEELRLELMAERKLRRKDIRLFFIAIICIVLFFVFFCFIYFNMSEWRNPNTPEEPVRVVEYIYKEKGTR